MSNGPFKKKIYPDNYTNEYNTSEGVLASLLFQKQCTGQGFGLLKGEIQTKKPFKGPRPILPSTGGLPGKSTSIQFFANQCKFSSYLPPPPSYLIPCTLFFFSLIFFLMDGARWDHARQKGPSSLTQFTITIENSNMSKYSTAVEKKREREKKTMFVYRGHFVLDASFCLHFILKQAA